MTPALPLTCPDCKWPMDWCDCERKAALPSPTDASTLANPARISGTGATLPSACPRCGRVCQFVVRVKSLSSAPSWLGFYSTKEARTMVCKGDGFRHFYIALADGGESHRLAWIESQ